MSNEAFYRNVGYKRNFPKWNKENLKDDDGIINTFRRGFFRANR